MARSFKTKVIINDRVDIAWLSGAHGVHLGQEDVPVTEARRLLGEGKIIGATAKTPEQAKKAEVMGANYVGSGAWFSTRTKEDAVSITFDQYLHILNTVTIPSLAVGGINKENCHLPLKAGTTVKEMLLQNGYLLEQIAVEQNGNILPQLLYEDTKVNEGDVFEVVQFVGGG